MEEGDEYGLGCAHGKVENKLGLSCAKLKYSMASKASQPKGYVKLYQLQEYALFLLENYYSGWGGVGWVGRRIEE